MFQLIQNGIINFRFSRNGTLELVKDSLPGFFQPFFVGIFMLFFAEKMKHTVDKVKKPRYELTGLGKISLGNLF